MLCPLQVLRSLRLGVRTILLADKCVAILLHFAGFGRMRSRKVTLMAKMLPDVSASIMNCCSVAEVESEAPFERLVSLPLGADAEGAVGDSGDERTGRSAPESAESFLEAVAGQACIHLVFVEAASEAVFGGEHGAGRNREAALALVDLPGCEE